jgi:2-phospho-L-lactate transferase/gluconeogenesis factor (CofD/UPF0052 family)
VPPAFKVVLFTGGRGSRILSAPLVTSPEVTLTLAINGYDDGASTGEVRRFLGDALGPSDFRKNAGWLARARGSCGGALIDLLEARLPAPCAASDALALFERIRGGATSAPATSLSDLETLASRVDADARIAVGARLSKFEDELRRGGRGFNFDDCAIGNVVFAGAFLLSGRQFNAAVDDYSRLVGLPPGLLENVTDGTNAYLVAVDEQGRLLGSEGDIVDARRRNRIRDIFLVSRPPTAAEMNGDAAGVTRFVTEHAQAVQLNPRLLARLEEADLIVYSPGTQHSSLFPSYLTPGLSTAIARNLRALKLLVTNLREDAEIGDISAVDLIERAVFYLKEKNRLSTPTPCLITHYLLNDPRSESAERVYVPLGRLETLEDPRLVRVANYEDGVTGRHDATKVLAPFLESLVTRPRPQRLGVWLQHASSANKLTQTVLEMIRGGISELPIDVTVFGADASSDAGFAGSVGFAMESVPARAGEDEDAAIRAAVERRQIDYLVLFDSSGMYRGEDIAALAAHLALGRLDAVWGSRRLSLREIRESYRLRYRKTPLLGAVSYLGSHLLSLSYLVCYGRYVTDTLSGVRVVRAGYLNRVTVPLTSVQANHQLLSAVLSDKADLLETPVHFFPLSPERVRRPGVLDGILSLANVFRWRFAPPVRQAPASSPAQAVPLNGRKDARSPQPHVTGR